MILFISYNEGPASSGNAPLSNLQK
jgi:hypothetical protein